MLWHFRSHRQTGIDSRSGPCREGHQQQAARWDAHIVGQPFSLDVITIHPIPPFFSRFVIVMLAGAALSHYVIPETSDIHGKARRLEDLAKGKVGPREMERREKEAEEEGRKRT